MIKLRFSKFQQFLISIILVVLFFFAMHWGSVNYPNNGGVGTIIFLVFLVLTALLWRVSTPQDKQEEFAKRMNHVFSWKSLKATFRLSFAIAFFITLFAFLRHLASH